MFYIEEDSSLRYFLPANSKAQIQIIISWTSGPKKEALHPWWRQVADSSFECSSRHKYHAVRKLVSYSFLVVLPFCLQKVLTEKYLKMWSSRFEQPGQFCHLMLLKVWIKLGLNMWGAVEKQDHFPMIPQSSLVQHFSEHFLPERIKKLKHSMLLGFRFSCWVSPSWLSTGLRVGKWC